MSKSTDLYNILRRKVIEDPREANRLFLEEFNRGDPALSDFYTILTRPSEGRLRQLVANTLRNHVEKRRVTEHLIRWREIETDEFTRRALDAALAGVDTGGGNRQSTPPGSDLGKINEIYRYLSSRLRHKMRNAMIGVELRAMDLRNIAASGNTAKMMPASAQLEDALNKIGRLLENIEAAPEYFAVQPVHLETWLQSMNARYAQEFSRVGLKIGGSVIARSAVIDASDYFLETAFWNLWVNAHQAVNDECEVGVEFEINGEFIILTVSDNGPGFTANDRDVAFVQEFSRSGSAARGRGLLEIQDAIERMGGTIGLKQSGANEYRIVMKLPVRRT